METNSMFFSIPLYNQPSFVLVECAIWNQLNLEHPFSSKSVLVRRYRYKYPYIILVNHFKILLHGRPSFRNLQCIVYTYCLQHRDIASAIYIVNLSSTSYRKITRVLLFLWNQFFLLGTLFLISNIEIINNYFLPFPCSILIKFDNSTYMDLSWNNI